METSKITEYKVGLFVVISTVLLIGFILALGGGQSFFKRSEILHLKAEETSGLAIGAVVQVAGLPSGNISKIEFEPKSGLLDISLKIDRTFMPRITQGSVAGIHTQGALGDKYVSIKPGPVAGTPMKDGDVIEAEQAGDLLSTLGKSGGSVEKVFAVIDDLQKMLHEMSENNLSKNIAESARNLKGASSSLNELLAGIKGDDPKSNKLKSAIEHFSSILEKIDRGQGTIGGLINDPTVHEDIKEILGGAKRSKILKYLIRQAVEANDEDEKGKTTPKK